MLLEYDQERLNAMYPDGIPEPVTTLLEATQRRRHGNNIGTGHLPPETFLLVTIIAEQQAQIDELKSLIEQGEKSFEDVLKEIDHDEDNEDVNPIPMKDGEVDWSEVDPKTRVMCRTESGNFFGNFVMMYKTGNNKGKLKITVDDSSNDFDVFPAKSVQIVG